MSAVSPTTRSPGVPPVAALALLAAAGGARVPCLRVGEGLTASWRSMPSSPGMRPRGGDVERHVLATLAANIGTDHRSVCHTVDPSSWDSYRLRRIRAGGGHTPQQLAGARTGGQASRRGHDSPVAGVPGRGRTEPRTGPIGGFETGEISLDISLVAALAKGPVLDSILAPVLDLSKEPECSPVRCREKEAAQTNERQ